MDIERWWPRLTAEAREWLAANNGEVVPPSVVSEITNAGGGPPNGSWWAGESGADGILLSDAAIDWIEESANGEH
ncbi:hypothetical protein [Microbacterium sp. NPDC087665]|uniref:hypothetical protein n=1 Tax=Microbacterium sp. NPDC087665 TaxID=3364194 RepID=UPI00380E2BAB